jgi:hypothetical protein
MPHQTFLRRAQPPLVLVGNGICFLLLYRHRSDDLNMRSTWLCSRNDIIANLAVLGEKMNPDRWPERNTAELHSRMVAKFHRLQTTTAGCNLSNCF